MAASSDYVAEACSVLLNANRHFHPVSSLHCLPGYCKSRPAGQDTSRLRSFRLCFARRVRNSWLSYLLSAALTTSCSAPTPIPPQHAAAGLGGTSWQLVRFQGGNDKLLTPDDPAKYTIAFGTDGSVSARIDCNRGRGTWKSSGPNHLQFGPLALTRATCQPGSLHDRIVKDWEFVRSYIWQGKRLFVALMADGGIYEFEPLGGANARPPEPATIRS